MSNISKRLDKVEEAIAPPASNEVRCVWVDGKDDGSAKIAELEAAGFQGQIITMGWGRTTYAPYPSPTTLLEFIDPRAIHGGDNAEHT